MLLSNFMIQQYLIFIYLFEYFNDVKKIDDFDFMLQQKLVHVMSLPLYNTCTK